jgi:iron complex outermembrane receptor protein
MKNIILICLFFIGVQVNAQKTIRLQNIVNGDVITNAHFLYQNQKGISSDEGLITITPIAEAILLISHVNYGKLEITALEVHKAIETGILSLEQSYVSLMPATVIARNNGKYESDIVKVNASGKLSHDAGSFLSQNSFISGIRKSGSYGFDPVMRGFKYDQLNIVMDNGLSATAACPNRMDPPASQIPLAMVDQVEIIRGPHSLRFGNAFGGSIHFKSKPASFTDETKWFGRASGSYESNGNIKRTEALAGVKGEFYNISLMAAYNEGNDYEDGDGNKIPSSFNRRNVGLSSIFKLDDRQSLKLVVNNNYAEDVDFPALNMDLREDDTWLMNIQHKINFKNSNLISLSTSVYGSFVDHTMDNLGKVLNPRKVNAVTEAKTKNYGARTEASFEFKNSSLFGGIDFKSEGAEGNRYREMLMGPMAGQTIHDNIWQDSRIRKIGLFGESHFSWDEVYFVASSRLEFNQAESRDKDTQFFDINKDDPSDKLNVSLSFGATYDISKEVRMGLWLGRAERSGGLTERFINYLAVDSDPFERIGNTKLKSEVNYQIDYNFTWKREHFELGVNLFQSYLREYISSEIREDLTPLMPTAPGVKQFVNIDKAIMRGFEFSWYQEIGPLLYHRINAAYTYGKNKVNNQALPEISPLDVRYSLGGHLFRDKFHPEFTLRNVSKQNRISSDYGETKTAAFSLLDFKSTYYFNDKIQVIVGVRNIADQAYYEHLSRSVKGGQKAIYAPGRSFYFTLSLGL